MFVERLRLGPLETNCFLVSDEVGGPVLVVDPGGDADRLLEALGARAVHAVVLTHAHFDHLGAAEALAQAGVEIWVHELDAGRVLTPSAQGTGGAIFGFDDHVPSGVDRVLSDGDEFAVGTLAVEVIHTPGHTQGGICLLVSESGTAPKHLFSGDTLFAGSVGRTDMPGGDARALSRAIATRLAPLEPDTIVHPGHGPDTTISREQRINPFWPRT